MAKNTNNPLVVDLFAGAGLLSSAFAREGFSLSLAVEQNVVAAQTYCKNLGNHILVSDVTKIKPFGRSDVLIAGPPCQGFSTLGKRDKNDPRNKLCLNLIDWAKVLRPKVVLIENVPAFLQSLQCTSLISRLEKMDYEVYSFVLNAVDYGLPQTRQRCFVFASKIGIPTIPKPRAKRPKTVREAWDGLPQEANGVNGHVARKPSELALARMRLIPLGGDKRDVLRSAPHLAPPSWKKVAGEVTDVWGRMLWDCPSNTIRTVFLNASKGRYIHPEQNRVITIREAARLQSIPDTWDFQGSPYQVARQIGNGVPLILGRLVARAIRRQFR